MADRAAAEGDGRLARIANGVGLALAFVGLTTLLAWLLEPLATPRMVTPAEAAVTGPATSSTPASSAAGKPRMAVLMIELGDDAALGQMAIEKLPAAIGLAYLPDGEVSRVLARRAATDGHENWIGIPMQPRAWPKVNPGKNTLLVDDPAEANVQRLGWALGRIDHPAGAYPMMGSAFTESPRAMQPIAAMLSAEHLAFIDSRSSPRSVAAKSVAKAGGRAMTNDMFLDLDPEPAAVHRALAALADKARRSGRAVGLIQASPRNIALICEWAYGLGDDAPRLVSPSELTR